MLGFVIGFVCLIVLFITLRRSSRCGGRRKWYGRRGPVGFLWPLLRRLETTPGQEKVIRTEFENWLDQTRDVRARWQDSCKELANAMRAERFDVARAQAWMSGLQAQLQPLRESALGALGRVHETLDERQREKLARLMESPCEGGSCHRGECV